MNTTKTSKGKKGLIEYIDRRTHERHLIHMSVESLTSKEPTCLCDCAHIWILVFNQKMLMIAKTKFNMKLLVWTSQSDSRSSVLRFRPSKPLASRLKCWTNPSQHNFFQTVSYILFDGQLSDTWTWETCDQHHKTNKVNEQPITSQEILWWDFETTFQEMPLQWDFELTNIPRNGDTWVSDKLKCLTIIFSAHQAHVAVVSTQFFTYNIFPTLSPKFPAAGSPTSQSETTPGPKRKAISPAIVQCNWTCDWSHLGCEVY